MKKRLRKKKQVGEFTPIGFYVRVKFAEDTGKADWNSFVDAFISDAIEANGLLFGGGGGELSWSGYVEKDASPSQCKEDDRTAVKKWLDERQDVASFEVDRLCNLNTEKYI